MPALRLLSVDAAAFADRHDLARSIAAAEPDVAVVHGAPGLLRWRSTCAAIARESGLVVVGGGRTAGGTLVLSDLGVDVEAQAETFLGRRYAARPAGLLTASLRRLGGPFVLAAGRLPSSDRAAVDRLVADVDPSRPPLVTALAGADVTADDRLAAVVRPVTGGVVVDLTLAEVTA